jgi:hypothetical protein
MVLRGKVFSIRFLITLSLFLIGSLHTLIFAISQLPENFLLGQHSHALTIACKIILYTCAVGVAFFHQTLCSKFGLRKTLYLGLLCNLFGLIILLLNQFLDSKGIFFLIILDMVFFGLAITSVINALVTYIIIEFPKKVGIGIVTLFAFLNLGAMLAPVMLEFFQRLGLAGYVFPFLIALLLFSLWFVHTYFFEPPMPPHMVYLKKGDVLWKELHYRLGLYVIAIIAYGLTESTFNLWGYERIQEVLGSSVANETISIFWLFLIIGQISLLFPLYFFPAKRVFYCLVLLIMSAGYYFSFQNTLFGFISGLAAAGFGCSAVFPILLSMMEKEILPFAHGTHLLFYIEKVIAVMIGGYFFGVGIIDLCVVVFGDSPLYSIPAHFKLVTLFMAIAGLIAFFLNRTAPKHVH